jgi:hypothetical protein
VRARGPGMPPFHDLTSQIVAFSADAPWVSTPPRSNDPIDARATSAPQHPITISCLGRYRAFPFRLLNGGLDSPRIRRRRTALAQSQTLQIRLTSLPQAWSRKRLTDSVVEIPYYCIVTISAYCRRGEPIERGRADSL